MKHLLFLLSLLAPSAWAQTVKPVADFNSCALPLWPQKSLYARHQGAVVLSYLIAEDGKVLDSKIKESSGHPELDMAAQQGIERCTFTPGTEDGKAVSTWMDMQYLWRLDDEHGENRLKEFQQAVAGAERGDAESRYKLGLAYLMGDPLEKNEKEGQRLMLLAAQQGWPAAQSLMGMLTSPEGPTSEGRVWFSKAAAQGDFDGALGLAVHLMGEEKIEEAKSVLQDGAKKNHASSQLILGQLQLLSEDPEELRQGIELITSAANKGVPDALWELANCYAEGIVVAQDYARAATLYGQAATNGIKPAYTALADLYDQGLGVPKNPERASSLRKQAEAMQ